MIFVTLGSQKFQFNRLLKKIDELVGDGTIQDEVFAQTGFSDYKPQNYKFRKYLDRDAYYSVMNQCHTVITHGGTGAIMGAVEKVKKVIAVPRLARFGEHVDDHQLQIIKQFDGMNLICACNNSDLLGSALKKAAETEYRCYKSNTNSIIASIEAFIDR